MNGEQAQRRLANFSKNAAEPIGNTENHLNLKRFMNQNTLSSRPGGRGVAETRKKRPIHLLPG